jgi:hypothetical protein
MKNGPNPDDDGNDANCESCGNDYNPNDGCESMNGDTICPDCMEGQTSY